MKRSINVLITTLMVISCMSLRAQNSKFSRGIYLTEQDYKANKLNYNLNNDDKMVLNEFLDGKNVSLTYHGKKIKLAKNEIYGYRLNNQTCRFYHNEAYMILDTAGFMLYSHQTLTQQGKGYKPVSQYFYSTNSSHMLLELTIENLWNSFPEQPGFRYSLQNYFNKNGNLMEYDKPSNMYKIKYLYFQQKQVLAAHPKFQ